MDRITKAFIITSLAYLLAGALLGSLVLLEIGDNYLMRFAHLHLMLLGFMAMMIYGVGYFILPRFNGTTIRWGWMVNLHFWVANLGLLGLCFAALEFRPYFGLLSLLGVALFVLNMAVTLLGAPSLDQRMGSVDGGESRRSAPAAPPRKDIEKASAPTATRTASAGGPPIGGQEIIGDLLAAYPELEGVFRTFFGDGCFTCPGQATETVTQAAMMHNIDPQLLLEELRKAAGGS